MNHDQKEKLHDEICKAVNLFYREWLKTNDPYEEDFESILEIEFPDYKFSLISASNEWLLWAFTC